MKLSEEMEIHLTLRTLLFLGGALIAAATYWVTFQIGYTNNIDRLDNVRNRMWVMEHPNHAWSKNYIANHPEILSDE